MWVYASGQPDLVDGVTPELRRYFAARAIVLPVVFLASIPIAAVSLTAGEFAWVGILMLYYLVTRHYRARVEARLRPAA